MFSCKLGCKMSIVTTVWLTATLKLFSLERKKQKQNLNLLTSEGNESLSQKDWAKCVLLKEQGNNSLSSKPYFCTLEDVSCEQMSGDRDC